MDKKKRRRPDEAALRRVLQKYKGGVAECVIRLAWTMGLTVGEILLLEWSDVSFEAGELILSQRRIPMDAEMQSCLQERYMHPSARQSDFIVTSDKTGQPMHRTSVFRAVRTALDTEESLRMITLGDLREDYIVRMLKQYDLLYVAKICGMKQESLLSGYSEYIHQNREPRRGTRIKQVEEVEDYEYKLWVLTQNEGTSPEGMTIWMTWQLGMKLKEVASLTWDQVDFNENKICVGEVWLPLGIAFGRRLRQLYQEQISEADRHVLLTPKSRRGFRIGRLSRITGEVLVRNGLENIDLWKLGRVKEQQRKERLLMEEVRGKGSIAVVEAAKILETTKASARNQLKKLEQNGLLTPIGFRYYLTETVVPVEKQEAFIVRHIKENGGCRRSELANVLNIKETQSSWILGRLVKKGTLQRIGTRYYLSADVENETRRHEKIRAYLKEKGLAKPEELAAVLNIREGSLRDAIKEMIVSGELVQVGTSYGLAEQRKLAEQYRNRICRYIKENRVATRQAVADLIQADEALCTAVLLELVREGTLVCVEDEYYLPNTIENPECL